MKSASRLFPAGFFHQLLESDATYFEAGAQVEALPGASIAHMPGFHDLAAGCVVQRVDPAWLDDAPDPCLKLIEKAVSALGARRTRIYLQNCPHRVRRVLQRRGYRAGEEWAVAVPAGHEELDESISLQVIETAADWDEKHRLHRGMDQAPDGHRASGEAWVAMERRKSAAGYMKPYLIRRGGEVVGAVNAALQGDVLRIKNLFVRQDARRRGVGARVVLQFAALAKWEGIAAAGAFVLDDSEALEIYFRAGYEVVGRQTEWCRDL